MEAKTEKSFTLTLTLNARETDIILSGLYLVHDFGDMNDWDDADALRAQIREAVSE